MVARARPDHSGVDLSPGGARLTLVATEGNADAGGQFLKARARDPEVTARGLRTISEVVAARYYIPPAMLARILREADPVATVSPDAVRFEGLSACCSTYARLDIDDDALDIAARSKGTTNVDFQAEMRAGLAKVRADTPMTVEIRSGDVTIGMGDAAPVVEEKVPLPVRWIKGLGEVQRSMAGMVPAMSLGRVGAQRLLHQLPRSGPNQMVWIAGAGGAARLSAREAPGAVPVNGAHRLRVLEILLPKAGKLDVFVNPETRATAWVLDCGAQRLTLVLNGDPWRGFSGDGGLLSDISTSTQSAVAAVRADLDWQSQMDTGDVARRTSLDADAVAAALGHLAAMGLVGFDLSTAGYFHRVLPFDLERIEGMNPRLKSARALVEKGAVTLAGDSADVASSGVVHRVTAGDDGWRCTCPWFSKNGTLRGPCKHVLAVEMSMEADA